MDIRTLSGPNRDLRGVGLGVHGDRAGGEDLAISKIKGGNRIWRAVPKSEATGREQEHMQGDTVGGAGGEMAAPQTRAVWTVPEVSRGPTPSSRARTRAQPAITLVCPKAPPAVQRPSFISRG